MFYKCFFSYSNGFDNYYAIIIGVIIAVMDMMILHFPQGESYISFPYYIPENQ